MTLCICRFQIRTSFVLRLSQPYFTIPVYPLSISKLSTEVEVALRDILGVKIEVV